MDKTLTVKLDKTLYDWIHTYAIQNDLSVSQVIRHSIRSHTKFNETKAEPAKPAKPADDEVGIDGRTKAERAALLARSKARAEEIERLERGAESAPTKTLGDVLSDWT